MRGEKLMRGTRGENSKLLYVSPGQLKTQTHVKESKVENIEMRVIP